MFDRTCTDYDGTSFPGTGKCVTGFVFYDLATLRLFVLDYLKWFLLVFTVLFIVHYTVNLFDQV